MSTASCTNGLDLLHGLVSRIRLQHGAQPKVDRQLGPVHAAAPNGIERAADAARVETNLANDAGFGDHGDIGDPRLCRLRDVAHDQVLGLVAHPVPILAQPRLVCLSIVLGARGQPGQRRAAVAGRVGDLDLCRGVAREQAKVDLGPHVERQDVEKIYAGASGDAADLFKEARGDALQRLDVLLGLAEHLRPAEGACLLEEFGVEGDGATDLRGGQATVGLANLGYKSISTLIPLTNNALDTLRRHTS
jgi:hypothetical protein